MCSAHAQPEQLASYFVPGTIANSHIVHPRRSDFYMCSHAVPTVSYSLRQYWYLLYTYWSTLAHYNPLLSCMCRTCFIFSILYIAIFSFVCIQKMWPCFTFPSLVAPLRYARLVCDSALGEMKLGGCPFVLVGCEPGTAAATWQNPQLYVLLLKVFRFCCAQKFLVPKRRFMAWRRQTHDFHTDSCEQ